jgi:hypothetical protein
MGPLVRKIDGIWTEWNGHNEPMPKTVNTREVTYQDGRTETEECEPYQVFVTLSASALGGWSADELAEFGLKRAVPFEVPAGKVAVGQAAYREEAGIVYQEFPTEDAPPPPVERRMVRKSTVQARLIAAGLMETAYAALVASPVQFARWFAPDQPAVYADDPDALAFLDAVGADVAVIMAGED